jgi:hypothetical protein
MRTRHKVRDRHRVSKRTHTARKAKPAPISSHPKIEEEIERAGCALDESQLKIDARRPARKSIVSVDGCDVKDKPFRKDRAA